MRCHNPLRRLAAAWFPLSLIVLLLLALPGVFLFLLDLGKVWRSGPGGYLIGLESGINRWLQQEYDLSFNILVPWWGVLLLLLVPLAILLLYFLKLKRKPLAVPSTFLWKKSIEDLHVNSLLQWLRQNALLLLQLLIVTAMIYALLGFRFHGRTGEGKHYILMIDNSASMSATDEEPTRLERAKQEALAAIDASADGDFGMVMVFNSSAEILQSFTADRPLLRQAVNSIQPTQRPSNPSWQVTSGFEDALSYAASLANPSRSTDNQAVSPGDVAPGMERTYVPAEGIDTEVHLFSDGQFRDVKDFAVGKLNIHYHLVGRRGEDHTDNIGIVAMNARRAEDDPGRLEVFAAVRNFRSRPTSLRLQLEVQIDGQLVALHEKDLVIPPREVERAQPDDAKNQDAPPADDLVVSDRPGEASVTFEIIDLGDQANVVFYARLVDPARKPVFQGSKLVYFHDQFPLDDEAWLVVGLARKARVLIVGPPNDILKAFFDDEATQRVAEVKYLSPEQLSTNDYLRPAARGDFDLVVFDRCGPEREEDMPLANTFFIGHPPPPWNPQPVDKPQPGARTVSRLESPHIKGWLNRHPVLRYLTGLHEVGVGEAFRLNDLPPRTPRLIETDRDAAVLLTLNRQSFTDLVLTFPILTVKGEWNTNWPLQTGFPLFLRNVLYSLGNISDEAAEETVQPGQVKRLWPDAGVKQLEVVNPAGQTQAVARSSRGDFSYSSTDTVGVYRVAGGATARAFAVNLLDPDESHIEPRLAVQVGEQRLVAGQERGQPRDMWRWVALAALLLLLAEWYIYNRRVYV